MTDKWSDFLVRGQIASEKLGPMIGTVDVMPAPTADLAGNVVIYLGPNADPYVTNHLYRVKDVGGTYEWVDVTSGGGGGGAEWGSITGTLANQHDLMAALGNFVTLSGDQTIAGIKTFTDRVNVNRIYFGRYYFDEEQVGELRSTINQLVADMPNKQDKLPNSAAVGYVLKATDTAGGVEWAPESGGGSVQFKEIIGDPNDNANLAAALNAREPKLPNSTVAGYYLKATNISGGVEWAPIATPEIQFKEILGDAHDNPSLDSALNGKQNTLPNATAAGKILKSTNTSGGVEWGDAPSVAVSWGDIGGDIINQTDLMDFVTGQIDSEANERAAGDQTLTDALNAEATERAAEDTALNALILTKQKQLTAGANVTITPGDDTDEISVSISAPEWGSITGDIDSQEDLKALFEEINTAITNEATIRASTDNNLLGAIDTKANASALANEANTRAAEDTALWTGVNEESATRQNADTELGTRIDGKQDKLTAGSGINISEAGVISCDIAIKVDAVTYYDLGRAPTENDPGAENTFYLFNNVPLTGQVAEYLCEPKGTSPETYLWTYVGLASMSFVKDTIVQNTTNLVENQAVYNALLLKQDKLPNATYAGKILKSTAVQGVVEWGDLPESGVQDVKVDGASVVTAGVAEIDLSGLVDLTSEQTITGLKTFASNITATRINFGSKYVDETILTGIQTVLAQVPDKEDKTNKVAAWQTTPDNNHYPTEKLVKDNIDGLNTAIGGKVAISQIVTAWQSTPTDDKIPSEKLTADTISTLVLQFDTKVDKTQIVTAWQETPTNNKIPSEKLVKDALDTKQALLPTTATAGLILKSTDTPGTVEWGTAGGVEWGSITGRIGDQNDLMDMFNTKANAADLTEEAAIREDHDVALEESIRGETEIRETNDNALGVRIDGKQDALPNATAAGMVLKSTDTAGGVEWGESAAGVAWGEITGDILNQADLAGVLANISDDLTEKGNAIDALETGLSEHETASNPHGITKSTVGLGNVDNTADLNKPISNATAAALADKVDVVEGKGLSTNDYTTAEKNKLAGIESGAEVNVIETVKVNGTALTVADKAVDVPVPAALSELTADSTHRLVTDTEKATWNGKQNALTFDTTPTSGSSNPVTSNGIKAALDGKAAPYVAGFGIGIDGQTINATTNLKTSTEYYDLGREPTSTDAGQIMTIYFIKNVPDVGATGQYVCEPQGTTPETYSWTCIGNTDVQIVNDASVSTTSTNGIQNQAITNYVNGQLANKADVTAFNQHLAASNPHSITAEKVGLGNVENKALSAYLPANTGSATTPVYVNSSGKITAGTPLADGAYKSLGSIAAGNTGLVMGGQVYSYGQTLAYVTKGTATVATTAWGTSTADPSYGFEASVSISGITANDSAVVTFNSTQALSGNFAPYNDTVSGAIKIYAVTKPTASFSISYMAIKKVSEA